MEELFAKIDAEPVRKPKMSFNLGAWLTDFVAGFSPRTLAYGATAAALAIVLQAGILAGVFVKEGAVGAQTSPLRRRRQSAAALTSAIRFKPEATAADITAFLERQQGGHRRAARRRDGFFKVRVVREGDVRRPSLRAVSKKLARQSGGQLRGVGGRKARSQGRPDRSSGRPKFPALAVTRPGQT